MSDRRRATGIVLAGGRSVRMGADKASLKLSNQTLLSRVVQTVSLVCPEVIIAGGEQRLADGFGSDVRWVADPPGSAGPLAGVTAGLQAARHDACLVVACDMPFLNPALLSHLFDRLEKFDAVVPVSHGVSQYLHAAYSRSAATTAQTLLRLKARSVHELVVRLQVLHLSEKQCARFDPIGLSCFNMNTPADLALALTLDAHSSSGAAISRCEYSIDRAGGPRNG
ncbi:MAG: molybdenum cofactor guanylyltransferase [Chloroflexi bacterium]|nr:molybdenum cofactor guanylyltransferase [Chloroflexota bacterium]